MTMPGAPFRCSETPFSIDRAAPLRGEHTMEILSLIQVDRPAAERLFESQVIA
jgi:crotonobetainyl-CoA:carnitine CoA-transferase CaiB-like acyl-CoA transferase